MPGSMFWVCALNALQNSMMLRPRWPSAGPIGGGGVALPRRHLQLHQSDDFFGHPLSSPTPAKAGAHTTVASSLDSWIPAFAGMLATATPGSHLFDLRIFELDRGRPAEDRHRDLDPRFLLVDFLDDAVERGERPVGDAHLLAHLEDDRRLRPLDALLDLAHDPRGLALADRRRPAAAAEEAGDLGGVLDEVPSLVVEVHLDQHIAREELALGAALGSALHLDDLLGRHQDLLEAFAEPLLHSLLVDRRGHLLLEAGIDV